METAIRPSRCSDLRQRRSDIVDVLATRGGATTVADVRSWLKSEFPNG